MLSLLYGPTLTSIHDYWKNHRFLGGLLLAKCEVSLLFTMFCRLVKAFLPRSNHLLISWLQSPSSVILEPKKIKSLTVQFSSVQFSSVSQACLTLCDTLNCSMPGLPVHHQLPESTQTHVHWVGDAIQPSHPLSSSSPPALNLSQHQSLCKWVSSLHQVDKVLEFQLQHQNFQWTTMTHLLQDGLVGSPCSPRDSALNHSSKASILWCSAFFIVELSHPYMTTGKTIALIRQTFVGKAMSLLFNMLSRLAIVFLPRSKLLLSVTLDVI